jgi:hypothetical protein
MARKSTTTAPAELDRHDATRASYVVGCHVDEVTAIAYADDVAAGDLEGAVVTLARRMHRNGVAIIVTEQRRIIGGGWSPVGDLVVEPAPEPEPEAPAVEAEAPAVEADTADGDDAQAAE